MRGSRYPGWFSTRCRVITPPLSQSSGEWSYRGLFPDSSYGYDSGGEPASIRELSYEEFTAYHAEYYHPSNCRVFLYGDIPTEEQLKFINDRFLSSFTAPQGVDARISLEPDWDAPRTLTVDAPVGTGEEGETETGATVLLSWRLGTVKDPVYLLAWEVLIRDSAGESRLPPLQGAYRLPPGRGSLALLRTRYGAEGPGIRRRPAGNRGRVSGKSSRRLSSACCGALPPKGIREENREAALATIDFRHREIRGGMPFGLRLMSRSLRGWLHGGSPESTMRYEAVIDGLKARLADEPDFFARMITEELLENSNRVTVTIRPDDQYHRHHEQEQRQWLAGREAALGQEGIEAVTAEYHGMTDYQNSPDPPEELAKIPWRHHR